MATVAPKDIDILEEAKRSLASDYVPSEDDEYMNEQQKGYFRLLLLEWKRSIHLSADTTLQSLKDGPIREPDLNDRASSETEWAILILVRSKNRLSFAYED